MRTASEDATVDEIRRDLEFLTLLWDNVQRKKRQGFCPALIYSDLDLVFRSVRDFMSQEVERLIIDSPDEFERLKEFAGLSFPRLLERIEL